MTANWRAQYSDGQSARSWQCEIRLAANGLSIDRGDEYELQIWPYSQLRSHTLKARSAEMIVERGDAPGAQLLIRDASAIEQLKRIAPQLTVSGNRRRWLTPLLLVTGVIIALIAAIWALDIKPARTIANLLPDRMRQSIGRTVVEHFKAKGQVCDVPGGREAMDQLVARLLGHEPTLEMFRVTVVDLPFRNAFATVGGQMIITKKMITQAQSPDEIAGVLAHEIGHGIERHPDAGLIRALGLSLLLEIISGGTGLLSSFSLHLLETGYRRQDERAADQQALRLLRQAAISKKGLEDFFQRLAEEQKESSVEALKLALDFLRTHPYPQQRLEVVRRAPSYDATPSLNDSQWKALRAICPHD